MAFTQEYIKSILGSLTYSRSLEAFKAGRVLKFFETESEKGQHIRAVVGGAFQYKVEIDIPKDEDMLLLACTCMAYEAFGRCKHIGAALMEKMKRDKEKEAEQQKKAKESAKGVSLAPSNAASSSHLQKRIYNNPYATLLLNQYAAPAKKAPAGMQNIKLVPQLGVMTDSAYASFTVGSERQYVIKDLFAFERSVRLKETTTYGTKLTLYHDESSFDERSKKLLKIIEAYVHERQMYVGNATTLPTDGRTMRLTGRALDEIFDLFKGEEIAGRESGQKWRLEEGNPNLSLVSEKAGDHIRVSVSPNASALRGLHYDYCVVSSTIYRMTEDFAGAMLPFLELSHSNELLFSPDGAMQFCESVLPAVEKHAPLKEDSALAPFKPTKCDVRFYIDLPVRSRLTAQPFFIYNGMTLTPETPLSAHPEINRDRYKESAAVGQLILHFDPPQEPGLPYTLENEDRMYDFLSGGMESLSEYGEVYVSDRLKNINVKKSRAASVGVSAGESVLNLNIDTGEFPLSELEEVLKAIREKRKYYRLEDGRFMNLKDSGLDGLVTLTDGLGLSTKALEKGSLEIPMSRALYLDSALKQNEDIAFDRDQTFKKLIRDFKTVDDSDFVVPEKLDGILRNYQKTGFRWLKTLDAYRFGGILADDMGLGKTLQVLTYLLSTKLERLPDDGLPRPTLIVCPASLVLNWGEEAKKWTPELNVCLLCGDQDERAIEIHARENYDLIVTSYDLLRRDIDLHEKGRYYACILDEAQYIKNHETLTFKAVKRIKSVINIAMTGTPVENRLSELWSIFDFLMPGYLYKYSTFRDKFESPIAKHADVKAQKMLKDLVSPFILRRMKKDVLSELPEKVETVQYVSMEEAQRKVYLAHVMELKEVIESSSNRDRLEILSMLTRLRQLCCDPSLFIENYEGGSCKMEEIERMLEELTESGHNVLVFSQFTSMLARIRGMLDEKGISYFLLQGDTPREERAELVKRFNAGEAPVFLISLKAGGTGLNLTRADTVIHVDPWWNIAAQNQATDRCYRIGQKRKVQVYQLIAKDTIEENILKLQSQKRRLAESVTEEADGGIMSMSKEDLMKLLD